RRGALGLRSLGDQRMREAEPAHPFEASRRHQPATEHALHAAQGQRLGVQTIALPIGMRRREPEPAPGLAPVGGIEQELAVRPIAIPSNAAPKLIARSCPLGSATGSRRAGSAYSASVRSPAMPQRAGWML